MSQIWQDAANLLRTAAASVPGESSRVALLLDAQNGLRIVDAGGWALDALQREYGARTAFTVTRRDGTVVVEGQTDTEKCRLSQMSRPQLSIRSVHGIPHHLIATPQPLLTPIPPQYPLLH